MKWFNYILSFSVLLLLMLPSIVHLQFNQLKNSYEKTVEERLSSNGTITITIKKTNLVWVKKGKEILLNGKYFDTKKIIENLDTYTITGWYDEEDTLLAKKYDHIKHQKKSAKQTLSKLFTVDYTLSKNSAFECNVLGLELIKNYCISKNNYQFEFEYFLNKPPLSC